jgi:hypothetical protein
MKVPYKNTVVSETLLVVLVVVAETFKRQVTSKECAHSLTVTARSLYDFIKCVFHFFLHLSIQKYFRSGEVMIDLR